MLEIDQVGGKRGEAGVAEGADGVEDGGPDRLPPAQRATPEDIKNECSGSLNEQCIADDISSDLTRCQVQGGIGGEDAQRFLADRHPTSKCGNDQAGESQDTEAPELDQHDQPGLAGKGQPGAGIHDGKAGDTDGACGHEN